MLILRFEDITTRRDFQSSLHSWFCLVVLFLYTGFTLLLHNNIRTGFKQTRDCLLRKKQHGAVYRYRRLSTVICQTAIRQGVWKRKWNYSLKQQETKPKTSCACVYVCAAWGQTVQVARTANNRYISYNIYYLYNIYFPSYMTSRKLRFWRRRDARMR